MYAIIETGGKQYRVKEGDILRVEKLPFEPGETLEFDSVLLVRDGDDVKIGSPMLSEAHVSAKVLAQGKGRKILVFKYKPKKNYRKRYGHRQPYTEIQIEKIQV
ncbi:MAG TPA: 50S ribosomal protein L21 [Firmicutes bacterium]|jgi:large subunit ribosomal protein L21|nr:50S ribosomal protein L21 [Bacillota bacterium]